MKPTILIVDDDESIRDIFPFIFTLADYKLDIRANGDDLFQLTAPYPDLFLIDKQLSGVNGLDICRWLKANPSTAHIPVIMISASPDIARLSEEAGADASIEKPFEVPELRALVRRVIYEHNHLFH